MLIGGEIWLKTTMQSFYRMLITLKKNDLKQKNQINRDMQDGQDG